MERAECIEKESLGFFLFTVRGSVRENELSGQVECIKYKKDVERKWNRWKLVERKSLFHKIHVV